MQDLHRKAVVSGGGTGIGLAIADDLLRNGYDVVILGRREEVLAAATSALASAGPGAVSSHAVDLSDPDATQEAMAAVVHQLGTVDVVVANAGRSPARPKDTLASHRDAWLDAVAGNTLTTVLLVESLRAHLSDTGRLIFISSIAALGPGSGIYGAAKSALHGWMYELATDLGPQGVTCNVVAPGFIDDTELFGGRLTDDRRQRLVDRTLVKRPGLPGDVAACVRWLASAEAGYVTAQVIAVDGGALVDAT